jgi:hypothetical protein
MNHTKLTKEMIGMEKISPSALECFEGCPKLFYYRNWLGLSLEQDKRHMDFGTAIHNAIGTIYSLYDNSFGGGWEPEEFENRGIEKVEDAFLSEWREYKITEQSFQNYLKTRAGKESGYTNKKQLYDEMAKDGLAILHSYWKEKDRMLAEYEHDLTEFEIAMKIDMVNPTNGEDKLPIPLSLRIDAVNRNRTKTVDFKTSGSKYDEAESRKKIQGQCYVFAQLMTKGKLIGKFDYIVLRKGLKTDDRIQVVQLEYDEADMLAFYERVRSILQKIANREFNRPLVGHSIWCDCKKYEEALLVEK